jgi:heterodisulfide reductase subunit B
MCQMNVDFYQGEMNRHFGTSFHMPILFFTQLMGLAFGSEPKALGIGSEVVSARAALARIGVEVPPEAEPEAAAVPGGPPRRPRRDRTPALPMPRMPDDGEARR